MAEPLEQEIDLGIPERRGIFLTWRTLAFGGAIAAAGSLVPLPFVGPTIAKWYDEGGPANGHANIDTGNCAVDINNSSGIETKDGMKQAIRVLRSDGYVVLYLAMKDVPEGALRNPGFREDPSVTDVYIQTECFEAEPLPDLGGKPAVLAGTSTQP